MAEFTLEIPDDQVDRVVDALCVIGSYDGPDDRKTRRDFARSVVVRWIRGTVFELEQRQAMAEAMAAITVDPVTID